MYSLSWNEFEALSMELAKKIQLSGEEFNVIVAVSRGGLLLGRLLSSLLQLPMGVIFAKNIDGKYFVDNSISSIYEMEGNVLLVDDVFEETANLIVEKIKKNYSNVKNISLACLIYKSKNNFKVKFSINKVENKLNIVFPYQEEKINKSYKYMF
jgi:hypoxanthine phosphoribosyltransferase